MQKKVIVLQQDLKDCGVACMQSIIKYYGGYVSIEKLREDTNTTEEGVTAFNIVNCFQKYGFDASSKKYENFEDVKNINYPVIAHVKLNNNILHFVVIYSIHDKKVVLMDPGVGKKVMDKDEFSKIFMNVLIEVHPRDKNIIKEEKISMGSLFTSIIGKEKYIVIKLIILSILFSLLTILLSYYFKISLNYLDNINSLTKIIIIFLIFTIMKILVDYTKKYYKNYLDLRIDSYLYNTFIRHIFYLPSKIIKSRSTAEIMTRVNDLESIKNIISNVSLNLFLDLFLGVVSLIILIVINYKLSFILIGCLLLYILLGILFNKKIYYKINNNISLNTWVNSVVTENIDSFDSVKNLNISDNVLTKMEASISNYLYDTFKINSFFNGVNFFKELILDVGFFIINSLGFILIYYNEFTLVDLITYNFLVSYTISPIKNIIDILPEYNYIKVIISKISEFLTIKEEDIKRIYKLIDGDITLSDVSYTFDDYNYVLKDLSFKINKYDKVFLKGKSGTGKSTICNLLYRNITPSKGKILLGDYNLLDYELSDIRNSILYINQSEKLIRGTIKDNIIMDRDVSEDEFLRISKICELESIVSKKGMRFHSLVDNNTKNLSGGEKQRIILARGLLKKSNILIIDEALSEVDNDLERKIIKNILENFYDKTIIYISHKSQEDLFNKVISI